MDYQIIFPLSRNTLTTIRNHYQNTTREQREQIVNDALGIVDGLCDGCSQGIISMYDAYIDGLKELDEINREFNAHYEVDDKRGGNRGGCSMM